MLFSTYGGAQPYGMSVRSSGVVQLTVGELLASYTIPQYVPSQWTFFCYAYDFLSTNATIFINGSQVVSTTNPTIIPTPGQRLFFGSYSFNGGQQCTGIWNASLSLSYVAAMYENQLYGDCSSLSYFSGVLLN
jgi:hypothetical protein